MKTPRTPGKNSQRIHFDPLTRVLLELCAQHNNRTPALFIKEMTDKYAKEHNISVSGHYNTQTPVAAADPARDLSLPLHVRMAAFLKEKREQEDR